MACVSFPKHFFRLYVCLCLCVPVGGLCVRCLWCVVCVCVWECVCVSVWCVCVCECGWGGLCGVRGVLCVGVCVCV